MKDLHIHMGPGHVDSPQVFREKCLNAGVDGGAVLSLCPSIYRPLTDVDQRWEARLDQILEFTAGADGFLPMLWIDPTELDVEKQINAAKTRGCAGFKMICSHFAPMEVLRVFQMIAEVELPILFHTGILYDERCSSAHNRPIEFECLMNVPRLRFAMAHISWPWCDECISLCGKFNYLDWVQPGKHSQLYVDLTPGTPPIFRKDALFKLFLSGYAEEKRVMWGTDNNANDYNSEKASYWASFDREIVGELKQNKDSFRTPTAAVRQFDDLWENISERNFLRFFNKLVD